MHGYDLHNVDADWQELQLPTDLEVHYILPPDMRELKADVSNSSSVAVRSHLTVRDNLNRENVSPQDSLYLVVWDGRNERWSSMEQRIPLPELHKRLTQKTYTDMSDTSLST